MPVRSEQPGGCSLHFPDISRIRKADLGRFTIDRLVNIHNRLDQGTRIKVNFSWPREDGQMSALHP